MVLLWHHIVGLLLKPSTILILTPCRVLFRFETMIESVVCRQYNLNLG